MGFESESPLPFMEGRMNPATPVSITALRTLPMFEALNLERLEEIARIATLRRVVRNAVVLHAGDRTDNIYIVLSGELEVQMSNQEGRAVLLSRLGPGEMFGEMGAIDEHPRSATVMAIKPCNLVVISKENFTRCLAKNLDFTLYIIHNLVKRLRQADRKIESLALIDVFGRVARLLLDMAEIRDGRKVVSRHITRQEIARTIGASREMVSRVMRDLQVQGLIEETDGCIWLRDEIGA
jgi:CRP/FNR family cyclic AMP-dependent transcriptional regulator